MLAADQRLFLSLPLLLQGGAGEVQHLGGVAQHGEPVRQRGGAQGACPLVERGRM